MTARSAATRQVVTRGLIVAVLSVLLGGVTFFAQGFLPDAASSFANSASGWTLLTAVLVYWSRFPAGPAAVLAVISFVLLVLGYAAVADLRGLYYDPMLFSVVGVVVGPFVGVATAWLRATGLRAARGTAALAGIGVGEAVFGLTVVGDTTSPVYWIAVALGSAALMAGMLARRIRGGVPVAVTVGGTAAVAAAYVVVYRALGNVGLG